MTRSSRRLRKDDRTEDITPTSDSFVEPELSNSVIITGQKMEDPPSIKIKKEFGVLNKKKVNNSNDIVQCFQNYQKKLQDQREIEKNTKLSILRDSKDNNTSDESDSSSSSSSSSSSESVPIPTLSLSPKKIMKRKYTKKILPSTTLLDKINKSMIDIEPDNIEENLPVEDNPINNDYCSCCGMTGMFICCESCPKSYHFQCVLPPIDSNNLPDSWYCKECIKSRNKKNIPSSIGIYGKLFDNILFQDTISFQLPREIIESFQDLSSDKLGDYNDNSFKIVKSYKTLIKEMDDPINGIYDLNNQPYFCYKCGESGNREREIINCDYCSLSWHLDCIDYEFPMTNVKKLGSKWKCPNHVDNLSTLPLRKFKNQEILTVNNIKNFEKINGKLPINANIEIINIEDKLKSLKDKLKLLKNDTNLKFNNITFQLSEEEIILDFINFNKIKKINENDKSFQLLMNLNPNLKDYIKSLSKLSGKPIIDKQYQQINFQKLLNISNDEIKVIDNNLPQDELSELLSIKRLLELKGKDKLIEFLKS